MMSERGPVACLERELCCLFGLPFDTMSLDGAVAHVRRAVQERRRCFVSTPNVNFVVAAQRDPAFRDSVMQSDLSLPDGMPIVWIARWLQLPLHARVAGADLFDRLRHTPGPPIKVYFFGGPPGVAARAAVALNAEGGALRCVGHAAPGFGSIDEMSTDAVIAGINRSGADFVVVSLGAAKGQAWIMRNRHRLTAPVISHLGAVVNFVAGGVDRAPRPWRRWGLEWVWRIKEEPLLWRRYWDDALNLARLLVRQVIPARLGRRGAGAVPAGAADAPLIEAVATPQGQLLRLAGAWRGAALRSQLRSLLTDERPVQIDLASVTSIDSELAALLLLLDARQMPTRVLPPATPLPRGVLRQLQWFGAMALTEPRVRSR